MILCELLAWSVFGTRLCLQEPCLGAYTQVAYHTACSCFLYNLLPIFIP